MSRRLQVRVAALLFCAACTTSTDEVVLAASPDGETRLVRTDTRDFGCHSTGHGIAFDIGFRDASRLDVETFGTRHYVGRPRDCGCETAGGEVLSDPEQSVVVVDCGDATSAVFYLNDSPTPGALCWKGRGAVTDSRMSVHARDILRARNGSGLSRLYEEVRQREGTPGVARALAETRNHVSSTWEKTLESVPEEERAPIVAALKAELQVPEPKQRVIDRGALLGLGPP